MLEQLENRGEIVFQDGRWIPCRPSFFDVLENEKKSVNGLLTKQQTDVLESRRKGKTLQEISEQLNLSRERVRQIEIKSVESLTQKNTRFFAEDRLAALYQDYSVPKDFPFGDLGLNADNNSPVLHLIQQ